MGDVQTNGRFPIEPQWPNGGIVSRPMDDRHFDVQVYTGYPSSTVAEGQWKRGLLARWMAPTFRPARPQPMYDPTDPRTYSPSYARS